MVAVPNTTCHLRHGLRHKTSHSRAYSDRVVFMKTVIESAENMCKHCDSILAPEHRGYNNTSTINTLVQTVNIAAKLTCLLLTHNETEDHRLYLTRLLEQLLCTFYFNCFSIP